MPRHLLGVGKWADPPVAFHAAGEETVRVDFHRKILSCYTASHSEKDEAWLAEIRPSMRAYRLTASSKLHSPKTCNSLNMDSGRRPSVPSPKYLLKVARHSRAKALSKQRASRKYAKALVAGF